MSVELIPNCQHCHQMGVANGTFGNMLLKSGMADFLGLDIITNDPISVTNEQARECRKLLNNWKPPEDWGGGIRTETMKSHFMEFFGRCDGFTTR